MPTEKQKRVAKILTENHRMSVSAAMREAGYSHQTATKPSNLTKSKSWQELMEEYLPDDKLAKVHDEGLNATRVSNAAILLQQDGTTVRAEEQGLIEVPDYQTRERYLDLAYKVKGRMKPIEVHIRTFTNWTPEELEAYAESGTIPDKYVDAGESES